MTILTTHVGSLPRSQKVVDFIFAREREEPYDVAAFDAAMAEAVDETVARQKASGVGIASDGETSKISYATYVKDRYTGFAGDSPRNAPADLKRFPSFLKRLADSGGTPQYARPMCVGQVRSKGQDELNKDIANLKAGMAAHGASEGFMNAASPGVIEAKARVITSLDQFHTVEEGEILVCRMTNPAWVVLFTQISGLVTDAGGTPSHSAVVSREFGLPAVVGTSVATKDIKTGDTLRVNGTTGVVEILN